MDDTSMAVVAAFSGLAGALFGAGIVLYLSGRFGRAEDSPGHTQEKWPLAVMQIHRVWGDSRVLRLAFYLGFPRLFGNGLSRLVNNGRRAIPPTWIEYGRVVLGSCRNTGRPWYQSAAIVRLAEAGRGGTGEFEKSFAVCAAKELTDETGLCLRNLT
jgi:hypothetical protein